MSDLSQVQSTSSPLLRQTREGDAIAQEQVLKFTSRWFISGADQQGWTMTDAMDNAQQVFVKLYGSLDSYHSGRGRFRSWLWQIARNNAIDHFRKQKRDEELHRAVAAPSFFDVTPESASGKQLPRVVAQKALEVLMDRYDGRTREVAIELLVKGRPASAVAEQFGISLGAVYTSRSRALKLLRESLSGLEIFHHSDPPPLKERDRE